MREDHAIFRVKVVYDFHVEVAALRSIYCFLHARKFVGGGLNENDLRTQERLFKPVGSRHCNGAGREEEEFVHGLQDRRVRVERKNALVLGLVESQKLGVAVSPCSCLRFY